MSLGNTLKSFCARLDEIALHQDFVFQSVQLGREAARFWDQAALAHEQQLRASIDRHRAYCAQVRLEDVCAGLSVQLFAAVEWCVGEMLVKSVGQVSSAVSLFDDLPAAVTRSHVRLVGRALSNVYEAPEYQRVDVDSVFRRLAGCVPGSNRFELNDYVFAFYLPNIDVRNLDACFGRIGLKIDWDSVGANVELQHLFGVKSVRKAGKASADFLDRCAKERNFVAHRGDGSATVQFDHLQKQLVFFRQLCLSVGAQVTAYLDSVGRR